MLENKHTVLAVSLLIGILIFLILILTMPSSNAYSVLNKNDMGLSEFYSKYKPLVILSYNDLEKTTTHTVVLIVNRLDPLSKAELDKLRSFLENGGIAVIAGDSLFLNTILSELGFEDRVTSYFVYDAVLNKGSSALVVAQCSIYNTSLVVYKPLMFNVKQGKPIANTSIYSYVDLNGNGYWDLDEPINSTVIAAKYNIGRGELYVIAAHGLITNNVVNYNDEFINHILGEGTMMVDQSFTSTSTIEYLKILNSTGKLTPYVALIIVSLSTIVTVTGTKQTKQHVAGKTTIITMITYTAMILYTTLITNCSHCVFLLVFIPIYYFARGFQRFLSGFMFIVLYLYLNPALNPLLGLAVVFSTTMIFFEYLLNTSSVEKPLLNIVGTVLVYTPIYILEPVTVASGAVIVLLLVIAVLAEYAELSSFKVELTNAPASIYLGDTGKIELEIRGRGEVNAYVYLNTEVAKNLSIRDYARVELTIKPEYAGLLRYLVKVELRGKRELAKLSFKPLDVTIRVVPRHTLIARVAKAILSKYIHEVGFPIIFYMPPSRVKPAKFGGVVKFNWSIPHRVYDALERATGKSMHGEYAGAREYLPGDRLRDIHWKKSISLSELIVKEYSSTPFSRAQYLTVIIADWIAPNPVELDMVIEATYGAVLSDKSPKLLFLKVPNGGVYLVKGKAIDVLAALELIIKSEKVEALFNYNSWPRSRRINVNPEANIKVIENLVKYYEIQASALINELEKHGASRGAQFYAIYSRPLSLKYGVVTKHMVEYGYKLALLRKMSIENLAERWERHEA